MESKSKEIYKAVALYDMLTRACADYFSSVSVNGEVNDLLNTFIADVKVQIAKDENQKEGE